MKAEYYPEKINITFELSNKEAEFLTHIMASYIVGNKHIK